MALTTRGRGELDWPEWFTSRFGIDWPEWPELFAGDTIRVEEFRDDGELVVRAELPDIDPENDVEITLVDHALRISAERRQSEEHRDKRGYRSEFRYGSFSRTVRLCPRARRRRTSRRPTRTGSSRSACRSTRAPRSPGRSPSSAADVAGEE